MAYPRELEDQEYKQYVIQMSEDGQPALPKDQWRMQKQMPTTPQPTQTPQPTPPSPEAMNMITQALMRRRM